MFNGREFSILLLLLDFHAILLAKINKNGESAK